MSKALAAFEPCGCKAWIEVLGYGVDAGAYHEAAKAVKNGLTVETVDVGEWKARPLWCDLHPNGPPWWKSHGGSGKRPTEFVAQSGLGL